MDNTELGFKQLDVDNWLQPDPIGHMFVSVDEKGKSHPTTGEEWIREILFPKLDEKVPIEVKRLFEAARGAMAYGYFFYPLFTLSIEQLYRVVEASVAQKWKSKNMPKNKKTLNEKINWLMENNVISQDVGIQLHIIRKVRNSSSHPKDQTIISPGPAVNLLVMICTFINTLFN
jgi:hypothetical protein